MCDVRGGWPPPPPPVRESPGSVVRDGGGGGATPLAGGLLSPAARGRPHFFYTGTSIVNVDCIYW